MNIPYALQLAHGWTRLAAGLNAASLAMGLPLCLWVVARYGMAGAALPWLLANLISVVVGIPWMHRRLLPGQALRWYLQDNLPPLLSIACPNILFPYAREVVSDVVSRAGFAPVVLQPVNFEALYAARLEQAAAEAAAAEQATVQ